MKFLAELFSDRAPGTDIAPAPTGDELDKSNDTPGETGEPDDQINATNLDSIADKATQDPDRQGVIRKVKGAHLVYKRETEAGTYEELWLYNVADIKTDFSVRRAILAGTDININKTQSQDGSQSYKLWSVGNAEMLIISGLPN